MSPLERSVARPAPVPRAAMASACWKFFAGLHRIHARARCPSGSIGSSARARRQWSSACCSHVRCGSNWKCMFIETKDSVACASANSGIALDGAGQMFRGAPQRVLLIGGALAQARHEFVVRLGVAAVSVARLRHSRAETDCAVIPRPGVRFRPGPRTRCPASKSCFSESVILLRRRIEQLHRDAPVSTQLLDRPLQRVANARDRGRPGRVRYPRRSSGSPMSARPPRPPGCRRS